MSENANTLKTIWDLEVLTLPEGGRETMTALRLHADFPLSAERRSNWRAMLDGFRRSLAASKNAALTRQLFIQMPLIPHPSGPELLSRNASRWVPLLALGVWPDREPPRSLKPRDLTHLLPGAKVPTLAWEVRSITPREPAVLTEVEAQMSGSGALLTIDAPDNWPREEGRETSDWLQQRITDETYSNYPFFVTLLDAKSLTHMPAVDREIALKGVLLYLREDAEQHCLYVIARATLDETMAALQQAAGEI